VRFGQFFANGGTAVFFVLVRYQLAVVINAVDAEMDMRMLSVVMPDNQVLRS